jgi:hypothetical protein
MVPSDLHVITRLSFRTTTSATDLQNQRTTFEEIAQTLLK